MFLFTLRDNSSNTSTGQREQSRARYVPIHFTATLLTSLQESERKAAEALERERAANEAREVRSSSIHCNIANVSVGHREENGGSTQARAGGARRTFCFSSL